MHPKKRMLLRNLREAACCWACVHSMDERFGLTCMLVDDVRIKVEKYEVCDDFQRLELNDKE